MKNFLRLGVNLMIVCGVAAGALALTYAATKDAIAVQTRRKTVDASKKVIAANSFPETPLSRAHKQRHPDVSNLYVAERESQKVGYVLLTKPRGYGGLMTMVVGVDLEGRVTGVAVVAHNETPGLGGNVVSSRPFLRQYIGKSSADPVELGKDIDAISGATITSRAVTKGTKEALDMYERDIRGKI